MDAIDQLLRISLCELPFERLSDSFVVTLEEVQAHGEALERGIIYGLTQGQPDVSLFQLALLQVLPALLGRPGKHGLEDVPKGVWDALRHGSLDWATTRSLGLCGGFRGFHWFFYGLIDSGLPLIFGCKQGILLGSLRGKSKVSSALDTDS